MTFGRQRVFAEFHDTSSRAGAPNWTWPTDWTGTWTTNWPWSADWSGASKGPASRTRTGTAKRPGTSKGAQADTETDEARPGSSKGSEEKTAAKIVGASKFQEPMLQ